MSEAFLDDLLDALVAAEPRPAWEDVLGRARRSRRRYAGLAVAVAALVLTPAAWAIARAFEGTPAPQSIQLTFTRADARMAAADLARARAGFVAHFPRADASAAHGVLQLQTADGPVDLWAAPTDDGGTCWFAGWESDLGAPDGPLGWWSCASGRPQSPPGLSFDFAVADWHAGASVVDGYVPVPAATVRVTLRDGRTATLPVVERLFLGVFDPGAQIADLAAYDAAGDEVASAEVPEPAAK